MPKNPYSFNVKIIKRSKGKSSVTAAAYQAGEKLIDKRTGRRCNYSRKKGVVHSEILAPPNSPGWARNRGALWNAVEAAEKRQDAQLARRFILALPKELEHEQHREYAREYIKKQFVDRGMVADFSIHLPEVGKNQDNHHMHLLVTMREVGPEGFGPKKNRAWNKNELLENWRKQWAVHTNHALDAAGFEPTWDHRTLEAQGEDRLPGVHLGPHVVEMEERGIPTDRGEHALGVARANRQLDELKQIEKEIQDEQRLGESRRSPTIATANPGYASATPDSKPENYPDAKPDRGYGQGTQAPPATASTANWKPEEQPARPISGSVNHSQGGTEDMLSANEYQEFLRVRRLMAQRQEEEGQQRRLSEEQKKRIEEMIRRTEEAALKRPDSLYWEDYFAMDCMEELRKRKQTVEQADWREIEGKVATGLLMDGATVKDAAEILYEKGVGAALDPATPPDGQTAGEKQVMEHLKSFAAGNPDLMDAIEQAEEREKNEARDVQREQMQQAQTAAPQPGA